MFDFSFVITMHALAMHRVFSLDMEPIAKRQENILDPSKVREIKPDAPGAAVGILADKLALMDSVKSASTASLYSDGRPVYVLYHADCMDGFGAAFAAWSVFGNGPRIHYLPVSHGQALPKIIGGSLVYILDFSYPRDVLVDLALRCTVRVIDHHKSAGYSLAGLSFVTFDQTKSGAVLTWEYFVECGLLERGVPLLLQYVQDRDLWKWELPYSAEFSAGLSIYPHTFGRWFDLSKDESVRCAAIDGVIERGRVVLLARETLVREMASRVQFGIVCGYSVPIVNATTLHSEVGHELLTRHPQSPFVATYKDEAGRRIWSLRSDGAFDVSCLAVSMGGGGHLDAAGFQTELPTIHV